MRPSAYSVRVSLESGFFALLEVERGPSNDGTDEVSYPWANVARWSDTVWYMPFLLMIIVWSFTLKIGKGATVFGMRLLYAIVAILSAWMTKKVTSGALSI